MTVKLLTDSHVATITDDDQIRIDAVLAFWFRERELSAPQIDARMDIWFGGDPKLDDEVKEEFADDVERASAGELDHWSHEPRGRLALILLIDQFRRNIFRGKPEAFKKDKKALKLCIEGATAKMDQQLTPIEKVFFYMPLQHSESFKVQKKSSEIYRHLAKTVSPTLKETFETSAQFAELHADIIERFGRFPHRNKILGRENTPEEEEYLAGDAPTFGQAGS